MTVILDGILSEIASVALLPRNDGWYKRKKPLGILDFYLRNSRIPYYVILGLDQRISKGNFRILVIASEAKQSLGILNLFLEF